MTKARKTTPTVPRLMTGPQSWVDLDTADKLAAAEELREAQERVRSLPTHYRQMAEGWIRARGLTPHHHGGETIVVLFPAGAVYANFAQPEAYFTARVVASAGCEVEMRGLGAAMEQIVELMGELGRATIACRDAVGPWREATQRLALYFRGLE